MARWGRGGMVGVGKAIYQHERALSTAALILESEHGVRHKPGKRDDLCPKCQQKAKPEPQPEQRK